MQRGLGRGLDRARALAERAPATVVVSGTLAYLVLRLIFATVAAPEMLARDWFTSGGWHAEIVRGLLLAYTPVLTALSRRSALDALEVLAPDLEGGAAAPRREVRDSGSGMRAWGALGGIAFALSTSLGPLGPRTGVLTPGVGPLGQGWDLAWALAFTALLGRALAEELRLGRLFARLGAGPLRLDLLDARPLRPFAQRALRTVLRWAIWFALSSLFLIGRADVFNAFGLLPLLVIALAALGVPARGVRARTRALKQEELRRVDERLKRAREALDGASGSAGSGFSDWAAYRERVVAAPEWPFDLGSLARLALYLALGAGSWLGAALVERVLDRLLA